MRPFPPFMISPQLPGHSPKIPHQFLISPLRHLLNISEAILLHLVAVRPVDPNRKGNNLVSDRICDSETMIFFVWSWMVV